MPDPLAQRDPDYDGEGEHVEVDWEDIEAERADRWREERKGK